MRDTRFHTKDQIIAEIDRAQELARIHLRDAELCESTVRKLQLSGTTQEDWIIDEKCKEAQRHRRLATSLLEVRCKWLGEKLAEFQTLLLPIIDDGDRSIPRNRSVHR